MAQQLSEYPWTRRARWRVRSRVCAVGDVVVGLAGLALFAIVAVDSVASWPSDRVLLDHQRLERVAAVLLIPAWLWVLLSFILLVGVPRRVSDPRRRAAQAAAGRDVRRAARPSPPVLVALALLAAGCVAVLAGGYTVGAAKGEVRALPGPAYAVSTVDLNGGDWTAVTAAQFTEYRARFVREDGPFTLFGLGIVGVSAALLQLHRKLGRTGRPGPAAARSAQAAR
jgi:hypothetical protein